MTDYQKGLEMIQGLISKRWIPEILYSVSLGNHRFTDILNSINYLSQTELQRKLKLLEESNCLIKDEVDMSYNLTEFGSEVNHLFRHFYDLGKKYQLT